MAAIHVRNVPDTVLAGLRERAGRHGRSMQQELLAVLAAAATEREPIQAVDPVALKTVNVGGSSGWGREEIYGDTGR